MKPKSTRRFEFASGYVTPVSVFASVSAFSAGTASASPVGDEPRANVTAFDTERYPETGAPSSSLSAVDTVALCPADERAVPKGAPTVGIAT